MLPLAAAAVLAFAPLPIGSEVRPTTVRIGRASVVLLGHSDDPAAELTQARLMIEAQRIMIDRLGGGGAPPAFDELINELTAELEAAVRTIEAKGAEIDELEGDLHDTEAALDAALILLEFLATRHADFFRWNMDLSYVVPPLLAAGQFHTFISHNWATGQGQARALKDQLLLLCPGLHVWLGER